MLLRKFGSVATLLRVRRFPTEECNGPNRPPTTGEDKPATLLRKFGSVATRVREPTPRDRRMLVRVRTRLARSASLPSPTATRRNRIIKPPVGVAPSFEKSKGGVTCDLAWISDPHGFRKPGFYDESRKTKARSRPEKWISRSRRDPLPLFTYTYSSR